MPEWAIILLSIVTGIALIILCGSIGQRLNLKNWHLGTILGVGILLLAVFEHGFFPIAVFGIVLMVFAAGVWAYRYFSSMGGKK